MKRPRQPTAILVCALAWLAWLARASSASAQTPPATEIFGGYSYLRDPSNAVLAVTANDQEFRVGWMAGVAQRLGPWLSVVGDVSGHYKRVTRFDDDVSIAFHSFMAGPRASAKVGRLTEFAQVLGGVTHAHASAFGLSANMTAFSLQPGGGVDVPIGSRLAARIELDYRWIQSSAEGRDAAHQFRAVAALVYR